MNECIIKQLMTGYIFLFTHHQCFCCFGVFFVIWFASFRVVLEKCPKMICSECSLNVIFTTVEINSKIEGKQFRAAQDRMSKICKCVSWNYSYSVFLDSYVDMSLTLLARTYIFDKCQTFSPKTNRLVGGVQIHWLGRKVRSSGNATCEFGQRRCPYLQWEPFFALR